MKQMVSSAGGIVSIPTGYAWSVLVLGPFALIGRGQIGIATIWFLLFGSAVGIQTLVLYGMGALPSVSTGAQLVWGLLINAFLAQYANDVLFYTLKRKGYRKL